MAEIVHEAGKLNVFISYSRTDIAFADQLDATLKIGGFATALDRHGIHAAENWKTRLGDMIRDADTVVFVLTATSAASPICQWEVEQAVRLGKRIMPVVPAALVNVTAPPGLAALNYIYFYDEPKKPGSGFGAGLTDLVQGLKTDLGWLREHTRLLQRASEWDAAGRPPNRLISGGDTEAAKAWVARKPKDSPEPTGLHLDFIQASETWEAEQSSERRRQLEERERLVRDAEASQRREAAAQAERAKAQEVAVASAKRLTHVTLAGLAVAVGLAATAGWFGYDATQKSKQVTAEKAEAEKQRNVAREQTVAAQAAANRAEHGEAENKALTAETQRTSSGLLANAATQFTDDILGRDSGTAVLLALEGLPDRESDDERRRTRNYTSEAELILDRSLRNLREVAVIPSGPAFSSLPIWSHDGTRIVADAITAAGILDAATGRELVRLADSGLMTGQATWSRDDKLIVAPFGKIARVWNAATGKPETQMTGHSDTVTTAAWSTDGSRILTVSQDGTARVWDAVNGVELGKTENQGQRILTAAWSGNDAKVVTYSGDTASVRDAMTGRELCVLKSPGATIFAAAWSSDAKRILITYTINVQRAWDAERCQELGMVSSSDGSMTDAAWSPDGTRVATTYFDGLVEVWNAASGQERHKLEGHSGGINAIGWSPNGTRLITASTDKTARVWDPATGKELTRFQGQCPAADNASCRLRTAAWNLDGSHILTSSDDGVTWLWTAVKGERVQLFSHDSSVKYVSCSRDLTRIVTAYHATATTWDAVSGKNLAELKGHRNEIHSAVLSPDAGRVVTASSEGTARVWNVADGKQLAELKGHDGSVNSAVWSKDGTRILTGSDDETVRIWNALDGTEVGRLKDLSGWIKSAAWSPDETRIVTASQNNSVEVWDAAEGTKLLGLNGHSRGVNGAVWNSKGTRILTAAGDGTARVWDAASGKQLLLLHGHRGPVNSAAWSSDESRIVTAGDDRTARVWDSGDGSQLALLHGHTGVVNNAVWGPSDAATGLSIHTASNDATTGVWYVSPTTDHLVQLAKARMPRCLTLAQRKAYFLDEAPPSWCVERRLYPYHGDAWQAWLPLRKAWLANREGPEPELPKETEP